MVVLSNLMAIGAVFVSMQLKFSTSKMVDYCLNKHSVFYAYVALIIIDFCNYGIFKIFTDSVEDGSKARYMLYDQAVDSIMSAHLPSERPDQTLATPLYKFRYSKGLIINIINRIVAVDLH